MITCQCRLSNSNKYTTLLMDIDNEGGYECGGQEIYDKFLYLPLDFGLNLLLKISKL